MQGCTTALGQERAAVESRETEEAGAEAKSRATAVGDPCFPVSSAPATLVLRGSLRIAPVRMPHATSASQQRQKMQIRTAGADGNGQGELQLESNWNV